MREGYNRLVMFVMSMEGIGGSIWVRYMLFLVWFNVIFF